MGGLWRSRSCQQVSPWTDQCRTDQRRTDQCPSGPPHQQPAALLTRWPQDIAHSAGTVLPQSRGRSRATQQGPQQGPPAAIPAGRPSALQVVAHMETLPHRCPHGSSATHFPTCKQYLTVSHMEAMPHSCPPPLYYAQTSLIATLAAPSDHVLRRPSVQV